METVIQNLSTLRDSIQRQNLDDTTVIDILTAFYALLKDKRPIDYAISDDKFFTFLIASLRHVPAGRQREYWFTTMFATYEKLSGISPDDANWLLLKANLIYLAPLC